MDDIVSVVPEATYLIRCCVCGSHMTEMNSANMCVQCLKDEIDLFKDMHAGSQPHIKYCKGCDRYANPHDKPNLKFRAAEWESRELVSLCLKSLQADRKYVVDAHFLYTEPHSKRVKLRLTLERNMEEFRNAKMQQTGEVEFIIDYMQCATCKRSYTPHTWSSVVQIRQYNTYSIETSRRTFGNLASILVKRTSTASGGQSAAKGQKTLKTGGGTANSEGARFDVGLFVQTNIQDDRCDFFFKSRTHAGHFVDFLKKHFVCAPVKNSKHLVSADTKNAHYNYKFTKMVEIAPIVKYDLCVIEEKLFKQLRKSHKIASSVVLCTGTAAHLNFWCPISNVAFYLHEWRSIKVISGRVALKEFTVMDSRVETVQRTRKVEGTSGDAGEVGKVNVEEMWLDVARTSDLGTTPDGNLVCDSRLLSVGGNFGTDVSDCVWGYDLRTITHTLLDEVEATEGLTYPLVVLTYRLGATKEDKAIEKAKEKKDKARASGAEKSKNKKKEGGGKKNKQKRGSTVSSGSGVKEEEDVDVPADGFEQSYSYVGEDNILTTLSDSDDEDFMKFSTLADCLMNLNEDGLSDGEDNADGITAAED